MQVAQIKEKLFPILKKIIIKGTLNSVKGKTQKNEIEAELKEFSKELYIKYWIKTAKEDTVQINIEHETKMAKKIFEKIYKKS